VYRFSFDLRTRTISSFSTVKSGFKCFITNSKAYSDSTCPADSPLAAAAAVGVGGEEVVVPFLGLVFALLFSSSLSTFIRFTVMFLPKLKLSVIFTRSFSIGIVEILVFFALFPLFFAY
jgi:hypothetical protein